jgi:hypothetical protein
MSKRVITIVRALDKRAGMSTTELAVAMRKAKPDLPVTASLTFRGRIKSLTITEEEPAVGDAA